MIRSRSLPVKRRNWDVETVNTIPLHGKANEKKTQEEMLEQSGGQSQDLLRRGQEGLDFTKI